MLLMHPDKSTKKTVHASISIDDQNACFCTAMHSDKRPHKKVHASISIDDQNACFCTPMHSDKRPQKRCMQADVFHARGFAGLTVRTSFCPTTCLAWPQDICFMIYAIYVVTPACRHVHQTPPVVSSVPGVRAEEH